MNGSIDPSRTNKEGLSQGSVISPLIFTIYIDDLLAEFVKDTFVSAYADDLLLARSARNKDKIVASLQAEVDKVVAWSDKTRLTHNTSKCEAVFFSLDCAEAAWHSKITIDGKRMFCNPFPGFLRRQIRLAAYLCRACAKVLPIDVRPSKRPWCSGWHDLGMAHF